MQQFRSGLFADAGNAGDVVDRVAHQRQIIDHCVRGKTVFFCEMRNVVFLERRDAFAGAEDLYARAQHLHDVLVRREDQHLVAAGRELHGGRADQVVGLDRRTFHDVDAQKRKHFMEQRDLDFELLGRRPARGFVFGIEPVAERRLLHVERRVDLVRTLVVSDPGEHVEEADQRVGRRAVGGVQFGDRVKGAKGDPVSVDEQNLFSRHFHKPPGQVIMLSDLCGFSSAAACLLYTRWTNYVRRNFYKWRMK